MQRRALITAAIVLVAAFGAAGAQGLDKLNLKGTVVTYWYQHSQARETALKAMIARFNSTNQWGITVKGEYAGGYSDIANKMTAAIAGGSPPDLVVAYQNNAASYELADALVDLNPYVSDATFGLSKAELSDFFPSILDQDLNRQFGNKRLGWPPNRAIDVLYYNADWLKALGIAGPPKTWEEFYADVKAATDPAAGRYGCAISLDASNVFAQVISRGGDFQAKGSAGYSLDSPQMRDSFTLFAKISRKAMERKLGSSSGTRPTSRTGWCSSPWALRPAYPSTTRRSRRAQAAPSRGASPRCRAPAPARRAPSTSTAPRSALLSPRPSGSSRPGCSCAG